MKIAKKLGMFAKENVNKLAILAITTVGAVSAHAQVTGGGGWINGANNVGALGQALVSAMVVLCAVAGVGAIGYAGKLLVKKAGDRGEDVEWSKIGYAVLGGAFFLSVSFVAFQTIETLGGSGSDMGKKITISR